MSYYIKNKEKCLAYQNQYNNQHKEKLLLYKRQYSKTDVSKANQKKYYNDNKEERLSYQKKYNNRKKVCKEYVRRPLPQYKIDKLEAMLRRKLKDIKDTYIQEDVARSLTPPIISTDTLKEDTIMPFSGFTMRNNRFYLNFD